MKNFKMIFSHPVKGVLRIFKKDANCASHLIMVDTKESKTLDVLLTDIQKGKWNLVLSWEHEEKQFVYNRSISIT